MIYGVAVIAETPKKDLTFSGRGRRVAQACFALGVELEGEHKQEGAKDDGIGTGPQYQDHCADKRLSKDAEDQRGYAAQSHPRP